MPTRGLLLDVEGVLVRDKRYCPVETALEFMRLVRVAGYPVRLVTNNTTDDRPTLVAKLRSEGFDIELAEVHTCITAALEKLRQLNSSRCFVLGNKALRGVFQRAQLEVVDRSDVDAVVVGLDTELTYRKLALACAAVLDHGAVLIALHRNRLYKDAEGGVAPGVGGIVAAVEYATQVEAILMGKPSEMMYQQVLDDMRLMAEDVLMVSDDPYSDLAGAKLMGMQTAFVLSGKYSDASVLESIPPRERPDFTVKRVGDLFTADLLHSRCPGGID